MTLLTLSEGWICMPESLLDPYLTLPDPYLVLT